MSGYRYDLSHRLGSGGQGEVYAVKDKRLAVKLLYRKSAADQERLRNALTFVRRLPLHDVPIARPLELLRPPDLGYVMELLTEMKSWQSLLRPPKDESLVDFYTASGGLRRRLRLLARCADALNRLCGKGLVYGDLSPNNVLISATPEEEVVFLIDADNLRFESSPKDPRLYTPRFGAPELVTGRSGVNSLTDAHAFAVLVFETLTFVHPLLGDWVESGDPDLEARALAGQIPWVDHLEDVRNRSSSGIPRGIVLSPRLQELAQRAFLQGLLDPLHRPGIADWTEWLHGAADLTIQCPSCRASYFFQPDRCPWCGAMRPTHMLLKIWLWDPEYGPLNGKGQRPVAALTQTIPDILTLTRRLVTGRTDQTAYEPCIELRFESKGDHVWVRSVDSTIYRMISADGSRKITINDRAQVFDLSWNLHMGPPDKSHRFMTLELRRGRLP